MSDLKFCFDIDQRTPYNAKDIIDNFSNYFGISFEEMKNYFNEYKIITKEELYNYIKNNRSKMFEKDSTSLNRILETRTIDYEYFKEVLEILSSDANQYLSLLEYVANLENMMDQVEEKELLLKKIDIFHYAKVLTGESVNKIFLDLAHLLIPFQEMLKRINNFETYHYQSVDSFMLIYGKNIIKPRSLFETEFLASTDSFQRHKSIRCKKKCS